jgi:hypothetical protein
VKPRTAATVSGRHGVGRAAPTEDGNGAAVSGDGAKGADVLLGQGGLDAGEDGADDADGEGASQALAEGVLGLEGGLLVGH